MSDAKGGSTFVRHSPHGVAVLSLVTSGIGPGIMGHQSTGVERRVLYEVGVHSLLATLVGLLSAIVLTLLAIVVAQNLVALGEMGFPINDFTAVVIVISPTLPIFAGFFVAYIGSLTRCERFMRAPDTYTPRGFAGLIAKRFPH